METCRPVDAVLPVMHRCIVTIAASSLATLETGRELDAGAANGRTVGALWPVLDQLQAQVDALQQAVRDAAEAELRNAADAE